MKKWKLSIKLKIGIAACGAFLLLALCMLWIRAGLIRDQDSQDMAKRWNEEGGVSQISCFFSQRAGVTEDRLIGFEHALDNALQEASIKLESENAGARLWASTYSAPGTISVSTERTTLLLNALGVGGDFFQFHPQELLYGNYFSGSDLNHDYVVIDEEAAWQLFGGIDVSGKFVKIGGRDHMIAGVISRPQGKQEKAAGLLDSLIYVSMETLNEYGSTTGINHYEIVMPNPIKDFAMQKVKENLGVDEKEVIYVENTGRFSIPASLRILEQYGYRSMNGRAIIFPYWENLARGCEDRLVLVTLFLVIFSGIPALIVFIYVLYRLKHKKWTVMGLVHKAGDLIYAFRANRKAKRGAHKKQKKRQPIRISFEEEENENK